METSDKEKSKHLKTIEKIKAEIEIEKASITPEKQKEFVSKYEQAFAECEKQQTQALAKLSNIDLEEEEAIQAVKRKYNGLRKKQQEIVDILTIQAEKSKANLERAQLIKGYNKKILRLQKRLELVMTCL